LTRAEAKPFACTNAGAVSAFGTIKAAACAIASRPSITQSSVKNFQVIDLESGNGVLGQLNLPEIGDAEGDSLQT
jgi:hypothetical protein